MTPVQVFSCEICKIFKNTFFLQNTSRGLLPSFSSLFPLISESLVQICTLEKLFKNFWEIQKLISVSKSLANLKTEVSRKQNMPNFPKNEHFLSPDTHVCVLRGKKYSFFKKIGVLCFLEIPVLRFTILPYYQRNIRLFYCNSLKKEIQPQVIFSWILTNFHKLLCCSVQPGDCFFYLFWKYLKLFDCYNMYHNKSSFP